VLECSFQPAPGSRRLYACLLNGSCVPCRRWLGRQHPRVQVTSAGQQAAGTGARAEAGFCGCVGLDSVGAAVAAAAAPRRLARLSEGPQVRRCASRCARSSMTQLAFSASHLRVVLIHSLEASCAQGRHDAIISCWHRNTSA